MKQSIGKSYVQWIVGSVAVAPVVALVAGCGGGAGSSMLQAPEAAPGASGGALEAQSVARSTTPVPTPTRAVVATFNAATYAPLHAGDFLNYRQTVSILGTNYVQNISEKTGELMTVSNGPRTGLFFPVRQFNSTGHPSFTGYSADTLIGFEQIGQDAAPGNHPAGTRRFIDPLKIPNGLASGQSETQFSRVVGTLDYAVIKTHIRSVKVVGLETVTVPAGMFHNCLKLIIAETDKDANGRVVLGNGAPMYFWAAPGVGLVKTMPVTGTSIKQELVSFKVGIRTRPL